MKLFTLSLLSQQRSSILIGVLFSALASLGASHNALAHDSKRQSHEHEPHAHTTEKQSHQSHTQPSNAPHQGADHDEIQEVKLTQQQIELAGVKVTALYPRIFSTSVYAPGEVKANGYTSYIVSPRTESVIISRAATLGEHVEKGQPLVTLFSESVAQAQAAYLVAASEWQRVKKLGSPTISESQLLKARADYRAAKGRLTAFGLTSQAITQVEKNASDSLGEYTLTARRSGAVLQDDFSQGQRIQAGQPIMLLADEKSLWVEARISPQKKLRLSIGSQARIGLDKKHFPAKVIQEAHTIDPATRTRVIRLAVDNREDALHSGMFVDVYFNIDTQTPVTAVPESALVRTQDGHWSVFVQNPDGAFAAHTVTRGQPLGEFREIKGLADGSKVVTSGAFYLASELAKGGFDPHNH